ncbi:hypothetical protein MLD38_016616 [Melastoma candidum]|uniref:Uncharacterized protein n=1 Tax=Melastoma candidum TaxID=119954 RepID=A0ACB9QRE8_9MYRT|nr:hypothetical protein MLD38_016616 [Melastoma candidum]
METDDGDDPIGGDNAMVLDFVIPSTRSDNGVGNTLRFVPEDVAPTLPIIADADNQPSSSMQNLGDAQNGNQADHAVSNSGPSENTIDPTFLEALPEDLLTEVLASQQAQPVQPHDNLSHLLLTDPVRAAVLWHHTAVANTWRLSSAFSA